MKGFHFRLEPVLALRRHREDLQQSRLAEAQRALDAEVALLRGLDGEMRTHLLEMACHRGPGPLDLDGLWRESAYLAALERQRTDQVGLVDQQVDRVAEEREAVVRASRDRKALEKVRETLLLAFTREANRSEQKAAEETATVRHVLSKNKE